MDVEQSSTKVCQRCGEEKEICYFHKNKNSKDGLYCYCNSCVKTDGANYYAENTEKIKKSHVTYVTANGAQVKALQAKYRKDNCEKIRAQRKTYRVAHKAEIKLRDRLYRIEHFDELKMKKNLYLAANKEHVAARKRAYYMARQKEIAAWRLAHRKLLAQRHAAWAAKHPEIISFHSAKARARKANAPINDFTAQQWRDIQAIHDHRCVYCGRRRKGKLTRDHLTPLSKNGPHTLSNILPACRRCNSRKRDGPVLVSVQPMLLL